MEVTEMQLRHYTLVVIGAALVSIVVGAGPALVADYVLTRDWFGWPSIIVIAYAVLTGGWLFRRIMRGVPAPEFKLPWHKKAKHAVQPA